MAKNMTYPDGITLVKQTSTKANKDSSHETQHLITWDFSGASLIAVARKAVGQMTVDLQGEHRRAIAGGNPPPYPAGSLTIKVADRLGEGGGTGLVVTKETAFAFLSTMSKEDREAALREAGYIE